MNTFLMSKNYHNRYGLASLYPLKFIRANEDSKLIKEFGFCYCYNPYDAKLIEDRLLKIDNHILANKAIMEECYDDLISDIDLYILNYKCDKFLSLIEVIKGFKKNSLNLLNNRIKRDFKSYMSLYLKKNDSLIKFMRSYILSYFFNVRTEEEDNYHLLYFTLLNNGIRHTEFKLSQLKFETFTDDEAYWDWDKRLNITDIKKRDRLHFYNFQIIFVNFYNDVVEKFLNF